jgi:hypothetical protein
MITTTFRILREHGACLPGYRKLENRLGKDHVYGQDTPITLLQILESNGVIDAHWVLSNGAVKNEDVGMARELRSNWFNHDSDGFATSEHLTKLIRKDAGEDA